MSKHKRPLNWIITEKECHEIINCKLNNSQYPRIIYKGMVMNISRAIWDQVYGPIPPRLYVLHSCDNKKCINPEHLFLGTQEDNMNDMIRKGRHRTRPANRCGENSGTAKLKNEDVLFIRKHYKLYNYNHSNKFQLALKFNVSKSCITQIVTHTRWKHI